MKVALLLLSLLILIYNCSPINKQHGYLLEDVISSADEMSQFSIGITTESDIFSTLGSPSIEIKDINNIWIYLISLKEKNVFEEDDIIYQSIFRFEFDDNRTLIAKDFLNEDNFTIINFSDNKTNINANNYNLADQMYEMFTRGQ
ncbi:hypothetical protein OA342_02575 [Pelagibacteraceae bacterium]|nr:hypothetical protein [Pelagibacteraceae bacterium]